MKSPALILAALTATNASSSRSNTRAAPRNTSSAWPATFATHPSGARFPRRIAMPPWRAMGSASGRMTFWPGVSRAARRHDAGDRVLERPLGDELARPHALLQEVHHELAGLERDLLLARVHGRHVVEPHRRDPEHLEGGRHRVGRELAAAGAPSRARPAFDRAELLRVDLAGVERADRLEDVLNGEPAAFVLAVEDRAAIEHDARKIEPRHGHDHRGDRLVAAGDPDEGVHEVPAHDQLDGVGDGFAADERGLHALGTHRDAVRDGDRVELDHRT